MQHLSIEQTPIHAFVPQERNARTHSKRQLRQIAKSIKIFGFNNPILTDDNLRILAGHGRLEAAKLLGMTNVPSIRLSHMSEDQKRAYVIADNELALKAGWDRETLALELISLVEHGFDVELTGFETPEIDLILLEHRDATESALAAEDQQTEPSRSQIISSIGDLWILGQHQLLCADSRLAPSYERLLGQREADLVFTDPPYNVRIQGHVSGLGRQVHREFAMASGEMSEDEFKAFLTDTLGNAVKVSRGGALHYVCMDWRHLHETLSVGRTLYSTLANLCVWNKDNGGMGSFYRSKHELVLVFKVGSVPHINNIELGRHGRNRTNVWDYAGVNTFRTDRLEELAMHPTVKPVQLIADAIRDASKRSDVVLDPFCGSGSTIIAAEKTGRQARTIEIDPAYVDSAIRRWQIYTGKNAYLDGTQSTFEQIAEARRARTVSEITTRQETKMDDAERADLKTRFKKGQSGNPKGRPGGSKNKTALLRDALFQPIRVKDGNGYRTVPKIVAALEVCLNSALKGDIRSFAKLMEIAQKFQLLENSPDTPEEITLIRRIIVDPMVSAEPIDSAPYSTIKNAPT
jgi:DNA modification methylase